MASLINEIKNSNIAALYLFYGEEAFKKRYYKEALKNAVTKGNMMNFNFFEGRDIDWQAVYDTSQTMPFFADKRLVIVENSGKFKAKGKDESTQDADDNSSSFIEKIINECPSTTCLAFFEENAAKNKKIFKQIATKGVAFECSADTEETLVNWLARGFAGEGKKVRQATLHLMISRTGLNYDVLRMEFEKVISYVGERKVIEDSDIIEITSENIESKIFDMLAGIGEKNVKKVLDKYYGLIANHEHPLYILAMLRSQIRTMLQVSELSGQNMSADQIARTAGKPLFVVRNNLRYMRAFSSGELEQMLYEISETDRKCKRGEIKDQIGVEMLLISFAS